MAILADSRGPDNRRLAEQVVRAAVCKVSATAKLSDLKPSARTCSRNQRPGEQANFGKFDSFVKGEMKKLTDEIQYKLDQARQRRAIGFPFIESPGGYVQASAWPGCGLATFTAQLRFKARLIIPD